MRVVTTLRDFDRAWVGFEVWMDGEDEDDDEEEGEDEDEERELLVVEVSDSADEDEWLSVEGDRSRFLFFSVRRSELTISVEADPLLNDEIWFGWLGVGGKE